MKKYDKVMMESAFAWSNESYCKRRKVGAIIADEGRIISNGYNGTISGSENNCEYECGYCKKTGKVESIILGQKTSVKCGHCNGKGIITNENVVHAEANAILFASNRGIPLRDTELYVTTSPCIECAKMIIQSGIKRVVYAEDYHNTIGKDFLMKNGIIVEKFN